MKKRIGILTSGGDTPGMNAGIRAVVTAADAAGFSVMAVRRGYEGLMAGRVSRIKPEDVEGIAERGGTVLGTARCEAFKTVDGQAQALKVIQAFGISGLVVIGGDGSFQGAGVLNELGVPTVGIPGTIDNDLAYTDFTIGFDTVVNGVAGEISRIRDTMRSHERVGVIETMGNRCGDIALYAGLAGGADHLIIPEVEADLSYICEKIVRDRIKGKMTSIVLVAEGAGKSMEVAGYIREKTSIDTKAVVIGYRQRGGTPTAADRIRVTNMGIRAVELLAEGAGGRAVGLRGGEIIDVEISEALNCPPIFQRALYERFQMMAGNPL